MNAETRQAMLSMRVSVSPNHSESQKLSSLQVTGTVLAPGVLGTLCLLRPASCKMHVVASGQAMQLSPRGSGLNHDHRTSKQEMRGSNPGLRGIKATDLSRVLDVP